MIVKVNGVLVGFDEALIGRFQILQAADRIASVEPACAMASAENVHRVAQAFAVPTGATMSPPGL